MKFKATFVLMLLCQPITGANAQSFDGVYKGTSTLTKIARVGQGIPNCPPIGHKMPILLNVTGARITAVNLESNKSSSGALAADGTFKITYTAGFWGGGPGSGTIPVTWSGRIRGTRIEGSFIVSSRSGECSGTIAAGK
jgi:hypothetical protein